jgi:hypothetical protein
MSTDNLRTPFYRSLAKVAQALASANRLQLLESVAQAERSPEQLAQMTGHDRKRIGEFAGIPDASASGATAAVQRGP